MRRYGFKSRTGTKARISFSWVPFVPIGHVGSNLRNSEIAPSPDNLLQLRKQLKYHVHPKCPLSSKRIIYQAHVCLSHSFCCGSGHPLTDSCCGCLASEYAYHETTSPNLPPSTFQIVELIITSEWREHVLKSPDDR